VVKERLEVVERTWTWGMGTDNKRPLKSGGKGGSLICISYNGARGGDAENIPGRLAGGSSGRGCFRPSVRLAPFSQRWPPKWVKSAEPSPLECHGPGVRSRVRMGAVLCKMSDLARRCLQKCLFRDRFQLNCQL
jgi:hypothetical protein